MEEHVSYEDKLQRNPGFVVEYEIDLAEDLKKVKPSQEMRVDFLYEGDDPKVKPSIV